jgi:EAL domain-containing protein (putative c-di-GMP-specific phosphodiesterase class I)
MQVIAEHVETAEELAILQALGVDGIQGYFIGKPQA